MSHQKIKLFADDPVLYRYILSFLKNQYRQENHEAARPAFTNLGSVNVFFFMWGMANKHAATGIVIIIIVVVPVIDAWTLSVAAVGMARSRLLETFRFCKDFREISAEGVEVPHKFD